MLYFWTFLFSIALASVVQVTDRPVTRQGLAGIKTASQGELIFISYCINTAKFWLRENIQGERACKFFNIAQSQYFVALMQELFYRTAKSFVVLHNDSVARHIYVARQKVFVAKSVAL